MPDEFQRARVLARDEFDLRVAVEPAGEIAQAPVDGHGDGALGERRRNVLGDIEAGNAGLELTGSPVGKSDRDHAVLLWRSIADASRRKSRAIRTYADGE